MRTFASLLTIVAIITITAPTIAALPNAPTALAAAVSGSTVTLTWSGPGGVVNAYVLEAGTAPGLSNAANGIVGVSPSYVATAVPPGVYFVRVRALDGSGLGPASNEIQVNVGSVGGCAAPPSAPVLAPATVTGSAVSLSWTGASGAFRGRRTRFGPARSPAAQTSRWPTSVRHWAWSHGAPGHLLCSCRRPERVWLQRLQRGRGDRWVERVGRVRTLYRDWIRRCRLDVPSSVTRVRIFATAPAAVGKIFSVGIRGQLTISERIGIGPRDVPTYDQVHLFPGGGGRITIVTSLDPTGMTWSVSAVP